MSASIIMIGYDVQKLMMTRQKGSITLTPNSPHATQGSCYVEALLE